MVAVHAGVNGRALHVLGLVLLASHIGNAVIVNPSVGRVGVAAVAGSSVTAVDQNLDRRNDVTLSSVGSDLDSVGNGRQSSVSPA